MQTGPVDPEAVEEAVGAPGAEVGGAPERAAVDQRDRLEAVRREEVDVGPEPGLAVEPGRRQPVVVAGGHEHGEGIELGEGGLDEAHGVGAEPVVLVEVAGDQERVDLAVEADLDDVGERVAHVGPPAATDLGPRPGERDIEVDVGHHGELDRHAKTLKRGCDRNRGPVPLGPASGRTLSEGLRTIRRMAVETRWVRYGRDAAEALQAEIVAAKGAEPLAPVTVVVPSNHVGVAARRLLASGRLGPTTSSPDGVGLVAVTFLTTYRLAELLGAPVLAGEGRRPVSTPVITAAVRARARPPMPGMFGAGRRAPGHRVRPRRLRIAELRDLDRRRRSVPSRPRGRRAARRRPAPPRGAGPSSRRTGTTRRTSWRRPPRALDAGSRPGDVGIGDRLPPPARVAPRRRAAAVRSPRARRGRRVIAGATGRRRGRRGGARVARSVSAPTRPIRPGCPRGGRSSVARRPAERTTIVVTLRRRRRGARGGPRWSSTRPGAAPRSTASRCSTPPPSPYDRLRPRAPRRGGHRHQRLAERARRGAPGRPHAARLAGAPRAPLPPPGRVRPGSPPRRCSTRAAGRRCAAWERISREAGVVARSRPLGPIFSHVAGRASASAGRARRGRRGPAARGGSTSGPSRRGAPSSSAPSCSA